MKKAGNSGEQYRVEGRTIRELESYLSGRQAYSQGRIFKAVLIFFAVAVLLVFGSVIWDLKQDVASLRAENTRLGQENSSLKKQLAGSGAGKAITTNTATGAKAGVSAESLKGTASSIAPQADLQQNVQNKTRDISPAVTGSSKVKPDGLIHHTVRAGEYLSLISQQYYGTIKYTEHLARLNGIDMNSQLYIGQIIKLPREPDKSWIE
jgi:LysM repeat protein